MLININIVYPSAGTHLTDEEKEYFVAYGETSANTVLATSAYLGAVAADYVDTSTDDQIWWATFPPLIAGNYSFIVEDTTMHSVSTTNITVP